MKNLQEIITNIKSLRIQTLDIEKNIFHVETEKQSLIKIAESLKYEMKEKITTNAELKNEGQREIALKKLMASQEDYINVLNKIEGLNFKIQEFNFNKTELSIDIEFYKNTLRVAEIEKAGN